MSQITILKFFNTAMSNIQSNYSSYGFVVERDLVWTIQKQLSKLITENGMPYMVYNDYPIEKGERRSKSVDLAVIQNRVKHTDILNRKNSVELAIEFKFEPSKKRNDICRHKLPVVYWNSIIEDIKRVNRFTESNTVNIGIAVFVDEYGRYRNEKNYPITAQSKWIDWGNLGTDVYNVSLLYTESHSERMNIK